MDLLKNHSNAKGQTEEQRTMKSGISFAELNDNIKNTRMLVFHLDVEK